MRPSPPVLSWIGLPALVLLGLAPLLVLPGCGQADEERAPPATPAAGTPADLPALTGDEEPSLAPAVMDVEMEKRVRAALAKGRAWLVFKQGADGSFGDTDAGMAPNVGYTAMGAVALIAATPRDRVPADPNITAALDWLVGRQKPDGSVHDNDRFINYMTSAAVGAFAASKQQKYAQPMAKGREYLARTQYADDPADLTYGGFPYAARRPQPPDLSNLQFAATALADAGLPREHEVWKRMQVYLSRVQNRSETNDISVEQTLDGRQEPVTVVSGDDGGAGYGPGMSMAGFVSRSDGRVEPRSYGSMTYALLKCLLLAGVDVKDPRVQAAFGWITRNFTVERNPGFEESPDADMAGQQGWYYYVFTLTRTLAEYERASPDALAIRDPDGQVHDWRAAVAVALLDRQREDGSWVNAVAERWDEGSSVLATSYAVQSLAGVLVRTR